MVLFHFLIFRPSYLDRLWFPAAILVVHGEVVFYQIGKACLNKTFIKGTDNRLFPSILNYSAHPSEKEAALKE
ncbi:MAG TPA: hypothetical protein DDZ80_13525 [Cyanobacteria bacterium UBA8803]|nr:hypothetical protein [Cyanobacteria bacterium UBA9273]HBL59491.1 hypothetical protein [Cyanobacteria bacterium UBA8803]